jgi:hypothetical protein
MNALALAILLSLLYGLEAEEVDGVSGFPWT